MREPAPLPEPPHLPNPGTPMDWPLLLEFTKALAAPTAAIVVVFIASSRAVKGFRSQKLIERRLSWYEVTAEGLVKAAFRYRLAVQAPDDVDATNEANDALSLVMQQHSAALIYAERAGYTALNEWVSGISTLPPPRESSELVSEWFHQLSAVTASVLIEEARKEMRLPQIAPRERQRTPKQLQLLARLAAGLKQPKILEGERAGNSHS